MDALRFVFHCRRPVHPVDVGPAPPSESAGRGSAPTAEATARPERLDPPPAAARRAGAVHQDADGTLPLRPRLALRSATGSPLADRRTPDGVPCVGLPLKLAEHVAQFLPSADVVSLWATRSSNVPSPVLPQPQRAVFAARRQALDQRTARALKSTGLDADERMVAHRRALGQADGHERELRARVERWRVLARGGACGFRPMRDADRSDVAAALVRMQTCRGRDFFEGLEHHVGTWRPPCPFEAREWRAESLQRAMMDSGQYDAAATLSQWMLHYLYPDRSTRPDVHRQESSGAAHRHPTTLAHVAFAEARLQQSLAGAVEAEAYLRPLLAEGREDASKLRATLARALLRQGRAREALAALPEGSVDAGDPLVCGTWIMALHSCGERDKADAEFATWLQREAAMQVQSDYRGQPWSVPDDKDLEQQGRERRRQVLFQSEHCAEAAAWLCMDDAFFDSAELALQGQRAPARCLSYFFSPLHDAPLWALLMQAMHLEASSFAHPLVVPQTIGRGRPSPQERTADHAPAGPTSPPLACRRTDRGSAAPALPSQLVEHVASFLSSSDIGALWLTRKSNEPLPARLLAQPFRGLFVAERQALHERDAWQSQSGGLDADVRMVAHQRAHGQADRRARELRASVERWRVLCERDRSSWLEPDGNRARVAAVLTRMQTHPGLGFFQRIEASAELEGVTLSAVEAGEARFMCMQLVAFGQYEAAWTLSQWMLAYVCPSHLPPLGTREENVQRWFVEQDIVSARVIGAEALLQHSLPGAVRAEAYVRKLLAREDSNASNTRELRATLARALLRQGRAREALAALPPESQRNDLVRSTSIMVLHSCGQRDEAQAGFAHWLQREAVVQIVQSHDGERWHPPPDDHLHEQAREVRRSAIFHSPRLSETAAWLGLEDAFFESAELGLRSPRLPEEGCLSYFFSPLHDAPLWPLLMQTMRLDAESFAFPLVIPPRAPHRQGGRRAGAPR